MMGVFGYENPKAPRVAHEEYERLQAYFESMSCSHLASFLRLVHFNELAIGKTMSFNFSLCRRLVPGNVMQTEENLDMLFSTPDILVGTCNGIEGAAVWCKNLSESGLHPDSLQVFNQIFGEAIAMMSNNFVRATLSEMIERVFTGDGELPVLKPGMT